MTFYPGLFPMHFLYLGYEDRQGAFLCVSGSSRFLWLPQERAVLSLGFLCTDGVAKAVPVQLRIGAIC